MMSKVIITSNILRFLLLLLIVLFMNHLFEEKKEFDQNLDNLMVWNETKNLFNLQEIYSPFNYSDLAVEDILNNQKNGLMSAMLTLEEGAVVNNDLAILRNYYRLGVRMIT